MLTKFLNKKQNLFSFFSLFKTNVPKNWQITFTGINHSTCVSVYYTFIQRKNWNFILPWLMALQSQWVGMYTLMSCTISFIIEISYKERAVSLIHFPVNSGAEKYKKFNKYVI